MEQETVNAAEVYEQRVKRLLIRGWRLEPGGMWSLPKHQHQGLPMLFTFEQACKAEGI